MKMHHCAMWHLHNKYLLTIISSPVFVAGHLLTHQIDWKPSLWNSRWYFLQKRKSAKVFKLIYAFDTTYIVSKLKHKGWKILCIYVTVRVNTPLVYTLTDIITPLVCTLTDIISPLEYTLTEIISVNVYTNQNKS